MERRFTERNELRTADGGREIRGVAAPFNSLCLDMGNWKERILPGAFRKVLASPTLDCRCLFNHDSSKILGRTKAGTLLLWEDESKGLCFECQLPATSLGSDLAESIRRKDLTQCSFGFVVGKQNWTREGGEDIRELVEISELMDVGPVCFAAYPQTSVDARTLFGEDIPAEIRSHMQTERGASGLYLCSPIPWPKYQPKEDPMAETERARLRVKLALLDD
jgi:hypothetical protein